MGQCIDKLRFDFIQGGQQIYTQTHTRRPNIKTANYALIINKFNCIFISLNAYTTHIISLNCSLIVRI